LNSFFKLQLGSTKISARKKLFSLQCPYLMKNYFFYVPAVKKPLLIVKAFDFPF